MERVQRLPFPGAFDGFACLFAWKRGARRDTRAYTENVLTVSPSLHPLSRSSNPAGISIRLCPVQSIDRRFSANQLQLTRTGRVHGEWSRVSRIAAVTVFPAGISSIEGTPVSDVFVWNFPTTTDTRNWTEVRVQTITDEYALPTNFVASIDRETGSRWNLGGPEFLDDRFSAAFPEKKRRNA